MKDAEKYIIKLNLKSIICFENLADKNYRYATEEDIPNILYACLISNNDVKLTFEEFITIMSNKKIAGWITEEYLKATQIQQQFVHIKEGEGKADKIDDSLWIRDIASTLIVQYGVDAYYIMNDLSLSELESLFKAAERQKKLDLEEKRFWTYLNILPHIDGKKLKSPEKLFKFPWEKADKEKAMDDIKAKEEMIKAVLGIKKEKKDE